MKPYLIRLFLTATAALACGHLAEAQVDRQTVDRVVKEEMERQELVGVAIGIIEDGEVAYVAGYGFEDRERDIPVTTDTMFRWASISKPLTAIAALQLAEDGKLDLDADVRTLVPEFPDKGAPITTRQLLGHLGGIVHYTNGPVIRTERKYKDKNPFQSVILALDTFKESPLVSEPGHSYNYTTHGYILASAVVERAGKQPFAEQVDQRIAKPNGLTTLQPDYQWTSIPNRAVGYRKSKPKQGFSCEKQYSSSPSTDTDVSWKLGGGGFISSIVDLAAFAAALCDEAFITPSMRSKLWKRQKTKNGKTTRYGLGFRVKSIDGTLVVYHGGAQEKVRGHLAVHPDEGWGIVAITNSEYGKPAEIAEAVQEALQDAAETP